MALAGWCDVLLILSGAVNVVVGCLATTCVGGIKPDPSSGVDGNEVAVLVNIRARVVFAHARDVQRPGFRLDGDPGMTFPSVSKVNRATDVLAGYADGTEHSGHQHGVMLADAFFTGQNVVRVQSDTESVYFVIGDGLGHEIIDGSDLFGVGLAVLG